MKFVSFIDEPSLDKKDSSSHTQTSLCLSLRLSPRHGPDNVTVPRVSDTQGAHTEVFSASSSQLIVVASVVVDTSLGQHGVVLDLRPKDNRIKDLYYDFQSSYFLRGGVLLAMMTSLDLPFLRVLRVCL